MRGTTNATGSGGGSAPLSKNILIPSSGWALNGGQYEATITDADVTELTAIDIQFDSDSIIEIPGPIGGSPNAGKYTLQTPWPPPVDVAGNALMQGVNGVKPLIRTNTGDYGKSIYTNREGLWLHCAYEKNLYDDVRNELLASQNATIVSDPQLGNCVGFTGNGYCRYSPYNITTGKEISVSLWVKYTSLAADATVINTRTTASDYNWVILKQTVSQSIGVWFTGVEIPITNVKPQVNVWYLYTFTVDAARTLKFYVNGSLVQTNSSIALSANNPAGINIGCGAISPISQAFTGYVKDARVWTRAIVADEISQIYALAPWRKNL